MDRRKFLGLLAVAPAAVRMKFWEENLISDVEPLYVEDGSGLLDEDWWVPEDREPNTMDLAKLNEILKAYLIPQVIDALYAESPILKLLRGK